MDAGGLAGVLRRAGGHCRARRRTIAYRRGAAGIRVLRCRMAVAESAAGFRAGAVHPLRPALGESPVATACPSSRAPATIRGCIAAAMGTGQSGARRARPRRLLFSVSGRERGHPRVMTSEHKKAASRRNAKRSTAQRTSKRKAVTKPYEPTPDERAAIQQWDGEGGTA